MTPRLSGATDKIFNFPQIELPFTAQDNDSVRYWGLAQLNLKPRYKLYLVE